MLLQLAIAIQLILICGAAPSKKNSSADLKPHQWTDDPDQHWEHYKKHHNKKYPSKDEHDKRKKIFKENHETVKKHNELHEKGHKKFKTAINHFGDWSHDEFKKLNGLSKDAAAADYSDNRRNVRDTQSNSNASLPESVDWRDKGYVTPVENQGSCGGCFSFSATGSLEGQHKRKTGKLVALSQQNILDCSAKFGNHGCNGGTMIGSFQYVKANGGIDTLKSYPYEGRVGHCRYSPKHKGATVKGFKMVHTSESALQEAVATVGPVSVGIQASLKSFQFYHSGVYSEPDCTYNGIDHGVLAVGYGKEPQHGDYWIVKNSWGPHWGDNGYVLIARNDNDMCGIASMASYPEV